MLNQWQALVYYCDDGIAEIDNRQQYRGERIAGMLPGSEEFLVLGADSDGERAAAMYSPSGRRA